MRKTEEKRERGGAAGGWVCACVTATSARVVTDPPCDATAAGVWQHGSAEAQGQPSKGCVVCVTVVCVIKSRVHEDFH